MLEFPQRRIRPVVEDVADCKGFLVNGCDEECRCDACQGWLELTFMKAVHIQLSDKRRDICMFKILAAWRFSIGTSCRRWFCYTYARTLEKSFEGDMRKLSWDGDHEIRCWMLGSSSILRVWLVSAAKSPTAHIKVLSA